MQKSFISFALAAGFAVSTGLYAQQPAQAQQAPNELVQYVRDAQKAGVKEPQIQQNAINAGWPAETVSMALKAVLHPSSPGSAPPGNSAATPSTAKPEPVAQAV